MAVLLCAGCSRGGETAAPIARPPYYVIDISEGPKAASYSATPLDQLPADFRSKVYKSDKLILKWIEPGSFSMGQILDATPIHEVTLSRGFYIGIYELTQAQWKKVMGRASFHFAGKPTHPAEMVSWESIRGESGAHDWPAMKEPSPESFMGKLSSGIGGSLSFDLPTEAQWEFACRAGGDTRWSFGNDGEVSGDYVWSVDNSDDSTREAGTRKPNAWGLFDMHGNVWEICLDRFGSYPQGEQTDPTGAATGWYRVWRGGGWESSLDLARSAHRNGGIPSSRGFHVGFRVAMSPR